MSTNASRGRIQRVVYSRLRSCIPDKKTVLACLFLFATAGVFFFSFYSDKAKIITATRSDGWWMSILGSAMGQQCQNCSGNSSIVDGDGELVGGRDSGGGGNWLSRILGSGNSDDEDAASRYKVVPLNTTVATRKGETAISGTSKPVAAMPERRIPNNRPPLPSGKTYSVLDPSAVITCPRGSPYVFCDGMPVERTPEEKAADVTKHQPYKVAVFKKAHWVAQADFQTCPYNNCINTGNTPAADTDHVHIYGVGLGNKAQMPQRFSPAQTWSFGVWESPHHTHADFSGKWNKAFNITMSYRHDSDVFIPYAFLAFEPTPLEERPDYMQIAKGKTKSVAWFVSNCKTPSKRMTYVKELKKHIDVDIYGGCGIPCKKKGGLCHKELPVTYKFYLSFENSLCQDYISEKFYKIYESGMHVIPVARGGGDVYSKFFPADTFVDATNFTSPKMLAEYLKVLGSDLERYGRMLEAKDQYRKFSGMGNMWCKLCEYLNTKGNPEATVELKNFWVDGKCHIPTDAEAMGKT